jgi:hypothetical protein
MTRQVGEKATTTNDKNEVQQQWEVHIGDDSDNNTRCTSEIITTTNKNEEEQQKSQNTKQ